MRFSYAHVTGDSNLLCLVSDAQVAYERLYLNGGAWVANDDQR